MAIFRNAGELIDADTGCHFVCVMAAGAMSDKQRLNMFIEQFSAGCSVGVGWWWFGAVLCGSGLQQEDGEQEPDAELRGCGGLSDGGSFHVRASSGGDTVCGPGIDGARGLWIFRVSESRAGCQVVR